MRFFFIISVSILLFTSCKSAKPIVKNTDIKVENETKKLQDSTRQIKLETEKPIEATEKIEDAIIEHDTTFETFNHKSFNDLLQKHVSSQGNVKYSAFKNDVNALRQYITSLGENMPNSNWSDEDKLAFWINAYNAMTIDVILRHYPVKSIKDIKDPWKQRFWKLGEKWYNLDEIEHQILRKMDEPRIHFAIVCASYSCPKLQNEAFQASNLDTQLTKATKEFLNDSERNSITENNLELSKIFKWFSKDFEQNGTLIDFLNQYSDIQISDKAKKSFKDYNWGLNE